MYKMLSVKLRGDFRIVINKRQGAEVHTLPFYTVGNELGCPLLNLHHVARFTGIHVDEFVNVLNATQVNLLYCPYTDEFTPYITQYSVEHLMDEYPRNKRFEMLWTKMNYFGSTNWDDIILEEMDDELHELYMNHIDNYYLDGEYE